MFRSLQASGRSYYGYNEGNFYCSNKIGDEEEDDDDIVLYKEQRHDPQNDGLMSQTHSQSQSSSMSQGPLAPEVKHTISRQERRRRRYEWKERSMVEHSRLLEGNGDTDEESGSDEGQSTQEDAFASLQLMLDQRQRVEAEQDDSESASEESIGQVKQRADKQYSSTGFGEEAAKSDEEKLEKADGNNGDKSSEPRDIVGRHHALPRTAGILKQKGQKQDEKNVPEVSATVETLQPTPPDFLFFSDGHDDRGSDEGRGTETRSHHKIPSSISVRVPPVSQKMSQSRRVGKVRKSESIHNVGNREKIPKNRRHSMSEDKKSRNRRSSERRPSSSLSAKRGRSISEPPRAQRSRSVTSGKSRRSRDKASVSPNASPVVSTRYVDVLCITFYEFLV